MAMESVDKAIDLVPGSASGEQSEKVDVRPPVEATGTHDGRAVVEAEQRERLVVDAVGKQLNQSDKPLEEGIPEELVGIMYETIQNYPFSVQFEENGPPVFSRFTDGSIDTFL